MTDLLKDKYFSLITNLKNLGSLAVAFSGGVDSTFLLYAAKEALGEKAIAVTISSDFVSHREQDDAKNFCAEHGIKQIVCPVNMSDIEHFSENPPDRCYYCKKRLFETIIKKAGENGITYVAEGSNLDDNNDYRPGHRAIKELGVKSPLREASLSKAEIRALSKEFGLPTWQKPSFACLASRIPYGNIITSDKLSKIEQAESYLQDLGFSQFRVRLHEDIARIEVLPSDFSKIMEESTRVDVYTHIKKLGFSYVTLDLQGYRTGSLNETL